MFQIKLLERLKNERKRFAKSDIPEPLKDQVLEAMDERIERLSEAVEA